MANRRRYSDAQIARVAYVASARRRIPTTAQLAEELSTTFSAAERLLERVHTEAAEQAYRAGYQARVDGKLFADNPHLEQTGKVIEMRFWVDGMVDAIVDERKRVISPCSA